MVGSPVLQQVLDRLNSGRAEPAIGTQEPHRLDHLPKAVHRDDRRLPTFRHRRVLVVPVVVRRELFVASRDTFELSDVIGVKPGGWEERCKRLLQPSVADTLLTLHMTKGISVR